MQSEINLPKDDIINFCISQMSDASLVSVLIKIKIQSSNG